MKHISMISAEISILNWLEQLRATEAPVYPESFCFLKSKKSSWKTMQIKDRILVYHHINKEKHIKEKLKPKGFPMKSCDLNLISEKLDGLDYNEAVLCSGLNNKVNIMKYAGSKLYILQGRGIHFVDELLERMDVSYELLTAEELFNRKSIPPERLVMILPSMEFEKIKDMKTNVVQFFHTYGTYSVKKIEDDRLILEGDYDEGRVEKVITARDLTTLEQMQVKPLGVAYKILRLKELSVEKENVYHCISNNIRELLLPEIYMEEEGGWVKGSGFYREVRDILEQNWNQHMGRTEKYVFVQSIQNGSSFFYRREFSQSMSAVYDNRLTGLEQSGNLWRKLSRYLKASVLEEKAIHSGTISELLQEIETKELTVINQLLTHEEDFEYVVSSKG